MGFFETLKADYYSRTLDSNVVHTSQLEDVYLAFWYRYKSLEQEELFRFLEQNLTEDAPYMKRGFSLMTNEDFDEDVIEILEDLDILLEEMLKEIKLFFDQNWKKFVPYVDEQDIENLLRNYGPREGLNSDKKRKREGLSRTHDHNLTRVSRDQEPRAYNYDLKRFFEKEGEDTLCTSALERH